MSTDEKVKVDLDTASNGHPDSETPNYLSDAEKSLPEAAPRNVHGLKWALACAAIYITAFLYGLDTTIAADVQAPIVETFGNVGQLTWIGSGFPLGSVAVILVFGMLYAKFDIKWTFIVSIVLFEVGSALCGAAPNMNALIVGRVIAGIGGSGIYLGGLNYLSVCTTEKERGSYIAGIGVIWGLGCILGPVIGGAFASSAATWRWAFYINLPIAAIFTPVYLLFLPSVSLEPTKSIGQKLREIDFLGLVLFAGMVTSFALAFTFGGTEWAWSDGRTIATLVVLGVILIAFILQQGFNIFTRGHRVFPVHLLQSRTQVLLYIATACSVTNLFVTAYYVPIFFQFTHGDSAIMAAVRLLPFVLVLIFFNMVAGFLLPRIGYYWTYYLAGGVLITIGGALMVTVHADTSPANIYGYTVLMAVGVGISVQPGYSIGAITRANAGHPEDVSAVVTLQNISQIGTSLISLVISGQVFQSYAFMNLEAALGGLGLSNADLRGAVAGTQSVVFTELSPELRQTAVSAITEAMGKVWIMNLVGGVLMLVISPLFKRERLIGLPAAV